MLGWVTNPRSTCRWAYEDPAPKDPQDSKGGSADRSGKRRQLQRRKLHAANSRSRGAEDSWQLDRDTSAASAADSIEGSSKQRRRMQEDEAEAWARRGPPLQVCRSPFHETTHKNALMHAVETLCIAG